MKDTQSRVAKMDMEVEKEMKKVYDYLYGDGEYDLFSERKFSEEVKRGRKASLASRGSLKDLS